MITSFVHDSPEWHAMRARNIGGSEVAALFDLPRDDVPAYLTSHWALWQIKSGRAPPPIVDNPRAAWGLKLEIAIAEAAAEKCGWMVRKGGYVTDPTTRGLGCTLDYIIESDPDEDGPGALELKNVDWLVHKRSWTDDEPPPHILLQLMHQLAATGYTWGCVAAFVGGNDLRIYRYKSRPKLITEIRQRVTSFWASIDEDNPPPVDGSDSATEVLRSLYPEIVDDAVDMTESNEWAMRVHDFYNAGEARKAANADYDEAKNHVIELLGHHKRGYGNGWSVNVSITPENFGRQPKPGELIGVKKEVRRYTAKEMI